MILYIANFILIRTFKLTFCKNCVIFLAKGSQRSIVFLMKTKLCMHFAFTQDFVLTGGVLRQKTIYYDILS